MLFEKLKNITRAKIMIAKELNQYIELENIVYEAIEDLNKFPTYKDILDSMTIDDIIVEMLMLGGDC